MSNVALVVEKVKSRIRASFDATRPGVTEFGITFIFASLLAGGSLGLMR